MTSPRRRTRIDAWALLAVVGPVVVVLALLLPFVDADPVAGVVSSNSPFTDEAWSVLNARNWAMFGTPATDEWTLHLVTLPFTVIDALVFGVFGANGAPQEAAAASIAAALAIIPYVFSRAVASIS